MKKWKVKAVQQNKVSQLAVSCGTTDFVAKLLLARGIESAEEAAEFCGAQGELSDPYLLTDMFIAVKRIRKAIDSGESIAVYGDYDCDGVTATVMLYSYLSFSGADVIYYIPKREGEGYGLNTQSIHSLNEQGVNLIITVDNGISAHAEAELIDELGMELIITDHHQPSEELPKAVAIINPHRKDDPSPFKPLCGAGVALKLICALEDGDYDTVLEQFCDLAAIGTIGDVVPLIGENRIIVSRGLELIANTENLGLSALIEACGLDINNLTATSIAFGISPRINAAGRFSSADDAVELLLCEDNDEAVEKAAKLCTFNTSRKASENKVMQEVLDSIEADPKLSHGRMLVVYGSGWNPGVIGIVASRLVTRFEKPVIIISLADGVGSGSGRSVNGFSLFKALSACDDLLEKFGGHTKAAGLTITEGNIPLLRLRLEKYAKDNFPVMPVCEETADMELVGSEATLENVESLKLLEPYGEGNPAPVFMVKGAVVERVSALKDGRYIRLSLMQGKTRLTAICFSCSFAQFNSTYSLGDSIDFLCSLEVNEYNNNRSVSVKIKELRHSNFEQDKYFAAKSVYEQIRRGEGFDKRLGTRIIPTRDEFALVYKTLAKSVSNSSANDAMNIDALYFKLQGADIPFAKLRIILDILSEFKLAQIIHTDNSAKLLPAKGKADLSTSKILSRLNAAL